MGRPVYLERSTTIVPLRTNQSHVSTFHAFSVHPPAHSIRYNGLPPQRLFPKNIFISEVYNSTRHIQQILRTLTSLHPTQMAHRHHTLEDITTLLPISISADSNQVYFTIPTDAMPLLFYPKNCRGVITIYFSITVDGAKIFDR